QFCGDLIFSEAAASAPVGRGLMALSGALGLFRPVKRSGKDRALLMINPQQASSVMPAIIRMALSKFFLSQSMTGYFPGSEGVEKPMISMRIEGLTSSPPRITFSALAACWPPCALIALPGNCSAEAAGWSAGSLGGVALAPL